MDPAQSRPAAARYYDKEAGVYFCDCWQCDYILRAISKSTYDRHTKALAGPLATTNKRKAAPRSAAPDPKRTQAAAGPSQDTSSGDAPHDSEMPFVR